MNEKIKLMLDKKTISRVDAELLNTYLKEQFGQHITGCMCSSGRRKKVLKLAKELIN